MRGVVLEEGGCIRGGGVILEGGLIFFQPSQRPHMSDFLLLFGYFYRISGYFQAYTKHVKCEPIQ